jgi:hypothetical protein
VVEWYVLVYKIPAEPTRYRAGVWRTLKAAGAIYLQNGVAALPAGTGNERVLRGLVHEVLGMQGTAYLLRGTPVGDETALVSAFQAARDTEYGEVLGRCRDFHAELAKERAAGNLTFAELEENEDDLAKLAAWLAKVQARDTFGAPLRAETEQALAACRSDLEDFAAGVYRAADHGSAALSEQEVTGSAGSGGPLSGGGRV